MRPRGDTDYLGKGELRELRQNMRWRIFEESLAGESAAGSIGKSGNAGSRVFL
jgi:hypothetical protein